MPSVIDVCNIALDKLGQTPIVSLADGTKASNLCDRNWVPIRDEVLRTHPWNFAMTRASLAPSTTAPSWGFNNAFPIPSDCLRLIEIKDSSSFDYQIENDQILADDSILYIRYIYQVTDPNKYDSMFVNVVATRLAIQMCESLTQSNSKKAALVQELTRIYTPSSVKVDGQENPAMSLSDQDWILSRF